MKKIASWFQIYWNVFPEVQLRISQHSGNGKLMMTRSVDDIDGLVQDCSNSSALAIMSLYFISGTQWVN